MAVVHNATWFHDSHLNLQHDPVHRERQTDSRCDDITSLQR